MRKNEIIDYLKNLRDQIVAQFETFEKKARFIRKCWNHPSGGGGEISLIRGDCFEKAAINFSAVSGQKFPCIDQNEAEGPYFATGVSLITHMQNPHAPTVHMNIRYIETSSKKWLGGGYDLTPMGFPYVEDADHFHGNAKEALDPYGLDLYPQFSQNAQKYFFIPHWGKERGVGGIFFDHFFSGNIDRDFAVWKAVGESFLKGIIPIYKRRVETPFSQCDREKQLRMRAHYVEFNLLYDKGTKFGFLSGGNPEAILCSMPPLVAW